MRSTTPEVAMLADVIESHSATTSVYQYVTGTSLHHSFWMYLTVIGQQNVDGAL